MYKICSPSKVKQRHQQLQKILSSFKRDRTLLIKKKWLKENTFKAQLDLAYHRSSVKRAREQQSCLWPRFYQMNFTKGDVVLVKVV